MKNLSTIPGLSLFAAFTILITLVVCLAGFTEAEVHSNFRKDNEKQREREIYLKKQSAFKDSLSNSQDVSNLADDELSHQSSFFNYYKSFPRETAYNKLIKRHSDDLEDSEEFDSEKENDGYGYDDDEYYHFNYKRNDDANGNIESNKMEKEGLGESNKKEGLSQKLMSSKNSPQKDAAQKEAETIEMLNFKESHPNVDSDQMQTQNANQKPFTYDSAHKKTSSTSDSIGALKMSDLKENSAIDEKMKDRKEESSAVHSSVSAESKIVEAKKGSKTSEEKDNLKLKDSKNSDESEIKEKKEKEVNLKENKDSVTSKNLKETVKSTEEKEKIDHDIKSVKLGDSVKLEENVEKFSSKNKDGETAKIIKEDKDSSRYTDKINADTINSNGISQFNNRASFVSNDYKDNMDVIKTPGVEEDEKTSEENDIEKNVGLNDYQNEVIEQKESLGEEKRNRNFEVMGNGEDGALEMSHDMGKMNDFFTLPIAFEIRNENPELYKKRESWKEHAKVQREQQQQEQQHQQQAQVNYDRPIKAPYHLNFPASELENTEYHKNYIKSLRRYKGLDGNPKNLNTDSSKYDGLEKVSYREKSKTKKKRSKEKKRRSMNLEKIKNSKEDQISSSHFNVRRNIYFTPDLSEQELQPFKLQSLSKTYANQKKDNRKRRNSPQKLEYEIKIINQNQQNSKNALSSNLRRKRRKKDIRIKLSDHNEDKYLKKYPYSQVSREDLTKFNKEPEEDKKFKRKATIWNQKEFFTGIQNGESHIRSRGVPSGYYSNRVKFGQKHFVRNDDRQTGDSTALKNNRISTLYDNKRETSDMKFNNPLENSQLPKGSDKNYFHQSWDVKNLYYKHDPIKRYDDNGFMSKDRSSNSLLLVKKDRNGEKIAKTFDAGSRGTLNDELDPDQLAKILSKDNDYVVLKKTDKNKFQKISDTEAPSAHFDSGSPTYPTKKSDLLELGKQENMKTTSKQTSIKNRGLYTRSSHPEEENKKLNKIHSSGTKSNLKKTFEKFRDLADFFRDNEQEAPETQQSAQDSKEGSDIVFSEDKLPDPIVINDVNGKSGSFKPKTQNSMSSISTNFKQLDQDRKTDSTKDNEAGKNMFISEVKTENSESSWEPALKNAFPEAKSINSMSKNGNEIIVLDFNRNQLKTDHSSHSVPSKNPISTKQLYLTGGVISGSPNSLTVPGNRQVEVVLNDGSLPVFMQQNSNKLVYPDKKNQKEKTNNLLFDGQEGTLVLSGDNSQPQISIPLNQIPNLPSIFKTLSEKKTNTFSNHLKGMTKKNTNWNPESDTLSNINKFLRDFHELTELNKDSYNKRGKYTNKRNLITQNQITLPASSFPELSTYSDANVKYLGNLLQNIMSNENVGLKGTKEISYDGTNREFYKNIDNEYQKSDRLYPVNVGYGADSVLRRQGQWTSAEEKKKDYLPLEEQRIQNEIKEDISNLLQSDSIKSAAESNHQNEIWEELRAASDKVQRLRREGMDERKLKKTIEDALSFRGRRQLEQNIGSNLNAEPNTAKENKKVNSKTSTASLKNKAVLDKSKAENTLKSAATESKNEKEVLQLHSQLKEDLNNKYNSDFEKKSTDSSFENHLSQFFENLNTNKNEKGQLINLNESRVNRRKRQVTLKRKRSFRSDIKSKVSRPEVQNKILKNLAEDNYQSVYSPGIKRKLLSTQDDAEDADVYFDADRHDNGKLAGKVFIERQTNCGKNSISKCIDPKILDLFRNEDNENIKSRSRRSVFHSNFKREIDLDESMPNDFQNFLVTSLGGFEGQKREVIKKDEALWEGKEVSQDSFNQIAENSAGGKDTNEDSALEKREVSTNENHKFGGYKDTSGFFETGTDSDNSNLSDMVSDTLDHAIKKARSQEKNGVNAKGSEFDEEKIPTHIRIQITNASSKEKKSSKPIMEESDSSSNDLDTMPKEKEFFEKNKLNSMHISNSQKLHQIPKSKYSYALDFDEGENTDNSGRQKLYVVARPYRRGKRKKKKYVQENPMKPIKDFIAFDQKAMETLIRKYLADQKIFGATTQKLPISNHLPQVETVYNPTQGTNKAQLDGYHPNKVNSLGTKNAASAKNSLQPNDASALDENVFRSYLKEKAVKAKGDKTISKDFEDVDWKPFSGKMRARQDSGRDTQIGINLKNYKNYPNDAAASTMHTGTSPSPRFFNPYGQIKWYQTTPNNNYFYHAPGASNLGGNTMYDAIKFKQDLQNWNGYPKDHSTSKTWPKPSYIPDMTSYKQEDKDKMPNTYTILSNDASWNAYDYFLNKKPFSQKFQVRDYISSPLKSQAVNGNKISFTPSKYKFMKNAEDDKQSIFDTTHLDTSQSRVLDMSKDADYLDTIDDDYLDEDATKQDPQLDDSPAANTIKKASKIYETAGYHHTPNYKTSDLDEAVGEEDEDVDEDYDENNEDDDLNDYSLLATSNTVEPEMTKGNHRNEKLHGSYNVNDPLQAYSNIMYPKSNQFELRGNSFEQAEFKDCKNEEKCDPGTQQIALTDLKSGVNPFTNSLSALKKANENTNIFGKNLMKDLNRYNYDDTWKEGYKGQDEKNFRTVHNQDHFNGRVNKRKFDWQKKLKRSQEFPEKIGSRLFYASKTEMYDRKNMQPKALVPQERKSRNVYYRFSKRNPMNAELRGAENEFEYETEGNGKYFNGNLLNGKLSISESGGSPIGNLSDRQENEENASKRDSEKDEMSDNVEDVRENLEDDGETISEDNVLENVIGKYIMRKSVKPLDGLSPKNFPNKLKDSINTHILAMHKIKKRSTNAQIYKNTVPKTKILEKRLSSGHLTENNFRKYHKKNLNIKRYTKDLKMLSNIVTTAEHNDRKFAKKETEKNFAKPNKNQLLLTESKRSRNAKNLKRSALDIFKKITNKDKDAKKAENVDVRTAGFEPLLAFTDKKCEITAKESEKIFGNEKEFLNQKVKEEVNSNLPNNGEDEAISEKKKEKSKDEFKDHSSPKIDGPWRIELNEKYDVKIAHRPPGRNSLSGGLTKTDTTSKNSFMSQEKNPELKAYLVISKNVRTAEQNPSTAEIVSLNGVSKREVGNSYHRKTDEGARNPKNRVWKRSLEYFVSWPQSNYRTTSGTEVPTYLFQVPIKETQINMQEKNRALHDIKSLSEGDSNTEETHVFKRNAENTSFVNTDARFQISNEKFPSKGRLKERKSIFPPSSDANIIRDSKNLNEESSKYLGQQIVDAILAHVSSNPRFKELIVPGLSTRTFFHEDDVEDKKRALHRTEFSDQVQSLLQKVMFDLEKLAEKHVKIRMCNKIDKQSKKLLQSLLNVPADNDQNKQTFPESLCSASNMNPKTEEPLEEISSTFFDPSLLSSVTPQTTVQPTLDYKQVCENLKKKRRLLLKLIEDYQNLSALEKETIDVNFHYLLHQLDETNQALVYEASCHCPTTNFCQNINSNNKSSKDDENTVSDMEPKDSKLNVKNLQSSSNQIKAVCDNTQKIWAQKSDTSKQAKSSLPVFGIEEEESKGTSCPATSSQPTVKSELIYFEPTETQIKTTTHSTIPTNGPFEKVSNSSISELLEKEEIINATNDKPGSQAPGTEETKPSEFEVVKSQISIATPESFDLLPYQNPSKLPETTPKTSESVRIKQSLLTETGFQNTDLGSPFNYDLEDFSKKNPTPFKESELHKLGIEDAAGLQLSLKYRGPWVSNLDLAKGVTNMDNAKIKVIGEQPKTEIKADNSAINLFYNSKSVGDPKYLRSLIVPNNDYSSLYNRENWLKNAKYYQGFAWPSGVGNKFQFRKMQSFHSFLGNEPPPNQPTPAQYFFRKHNFSRKRLPDGKGCDICGNKNQKIEITQKMDTYQILEPNEKSNFNEKLQLKKRKKRLPYLERWRQKHPKAKHKSENVKNGENIDSEKNLRYEFFSKFP